jgi:ABC-type branched-subunit amino acid transport system substrate-binding protein
MKGQVFAATLLRQVRSVAVVVALCAVAFLVSCGSQEPAPSGPAPTSTPEAVLPLPSGASDTSGITSDGIVFGQSAAFTGPAQELGINMRLGIRAAFEEANQAGGVHGRQLSLASLDDTYEPELAAINTRELIQDEGVFALIGEVGTPTSRSATPVAADANVPFVAPFTGAAFLRDVDTWNNIINMRASYNDETEEMVKRFTEDLGIERIGVLYQDDSFGRAGYNGALAALERRGMEPVAVGLYPRNTTAVKTALLDLSKGRPQGIIMVGAYNPIGEFVLWAKETKLLDDADYEAKFIAISFVGSNALAEKLGSKGEGVYVTQVVPFPTDTSLPIVSSYLKALADFDPEAVPGFVSFEGYLAGRLAIAGLERCGRDVNRTCFMDSLLRGSSMDIGGFPLSYSSEDNQGSDTVFLTVIGADGQYHPIENLADAVN